MHYKKTLKTIINLILIAFVYMLGCSVSPITPEKMKTPENSSTGLALFKIAASADSPFMDIASRAVLTISAADMITMTSELNITDSSVEGTITGVPAGTNRLFEVAVYDSLDSLKYRGSAIANVIADSTVVVTITVSRLVGVTVINGSIDEGSTIPVDGLMAYYPFNGNADDESGNGNDGTVNGAILTEDRFGNADKAYSFDGVDDKITAGEIQNDGALTVCAWVKLDTLFQQSFIVADWDVNFGSLQFLCSPPDRLGFAIRWAAGTPEGSSMAYSDEVVEIGKWLFLCASHGPDAIISLYVNGNLVQNTQEQKGTSPVFPISGTGLNIGFQDTGDGPFNGQIDDIRIYDHVLSIDEISAIYNE